MKESKISSTEQYINNIEKWFFEFEKQMKEFYKTKQENPTIEVIQKQINVINKAIKHTFHYSNFFLYHIPTELFSKSKYYNIREKNAILRYETYKNTKSKKRYDTLSKYIKTKIWDINYFAETFFELLIVIEKILLMQIKNLQSIKDLKEFENEENIKFKNIRLNIKKTQLLIEKKLLGDFEYNLSQEEMLFSSFFKLVKNKDLENIWKLDIFLENNKKAMLGILSWFSLNLFPEEGFSDIASIIPYMYALFYKYKNRNSPFEGSKYEDLNQKS